MEELGHELAELIRIIVAFINEYPYWTIFFICWKLAAGGSSSSVRISKENKN